LTKFWGRAVFVFLNKLAKNVNSAYILEHVRRFIDGVNLWLFFFAPFTAIETEQLCGAAQMNRTVSLNK